MHKKSLTILALMTFGLITSVHSSVLNQILTLDTKISNSFENPTYLLLGERLFFVEYEQLYYENEGSVAVA